MIPAIINAQFPETFKLSALTTNILICFHKQSKLGHLKKIWWGKNSSKIRAVFFFQHKRAASVFTDPLDCPRGMIVVPPLIVKTNFTANYHRWWDKIIAIRQNP